MKAVYGENTACKDIQITFNSQHLLKLQLGCQFVSCHVLQRTRYVLVKNSPKELLFDMYIASCFRRQLSFCFLFF